MTWEFQSWTKVLEICKSAEFGTVGTREGRSRVQVRMEIMRNRVRCDLEEVDPVQSFDRRWWRWTNIIARLEGHSTGGNRR